jgi:hypothetical protein
VQVLLGLALQGRWQLVEHIGCLVHRKRSLLPTLRSVCRAGEGCGLVPGLLLRA